jgi:hypothetical protein
MRSRFSLAVAFGLALALGATGCGTPCQDLGDRICNCEGEGQIRNNCKTDVKARVSASNATASEQDYCSAKLATCPDPNGDINKCAYILNTCPGRVACGLALPTPGGGDGCTTIEVPALQSMPDAL